VTVVSVRGLILVTTAVVLLFAALVRGLSTPRESGVAASGDSVAPNRVRAREFWELYRAAGEHRLGGRIDSAAALYARALERDPTHQDALYYLGNMRLQQGDFAAAEQAWRRLVGVDPASARAHSQLGNLHLCADSGAPFDPARAEAEFALAHAINGEETGPVLQLGEAALLRGDPASARRHFLAVLGSHPDNVPARFYLGYLDWAAGDRDAARAAFAGAADAAPAPPPAGASNEGDTRRGARPMLASPVRCAGLRELSRGLAGMHQGNRDREMEKRYRALDRLRSVGRARLTSRVK
jgi:tetratricopeptide (TPR) repeat protein